MTTLFDISPEAHIRIWEPALNAIEEYIAAVPPERGAALFGCNSVVSLAVSDTSGTYSSVSWDISADLGSAVGQIEAAGVGEFIGTVHSHPRGVVNPSGGDVASTMNLLSQNPHLDSVLVAVVTEGAAVEFNHVPVGRRHRMSLHLMAQHEGRPVVVPIPGLIVPLQRGLVAAGAGDRIGALALSSWIQDPERERARLPRLVRNQVVEGFAFPAEPGRRGEPRELVVPLTYPIAGPLLVAEDLAGKKRLMSLGWNPVNDPEEQLEQLMPFPTVIPQRGTSPPLAAHAASQPDGETATDRVVSLVGELTNCHVLVAGGGSVGSGIAEDLVRAGVGRLTVLDPDIVSAPNIARSAYRYRDIGRLKTEALEEILTSINPDLTFAGIPRAIIDTPALDSVVADVDIVVGATDDMTQQFVLAHYAYSAGVPIVCCALYKGAQCGEVILAVPEVGTPCVSCTLGNSVNTAGLKPVQDYGLGGRLAKEPGLGASISVVRSVASLAVLGILAGAESIAAQLVRRALVSGQTLAMVSTVPEWGFFPDLLGTDAHQNAPQSVWCSADRSATCPVCGPEELRVPPG